MGATFSTGEVISGFSSVGDGELGSAVGVDRVDEVETGLEGSEDEGVGRSV